MSFTTHYYECVRHTLRASLNRLFCRYGQRLIWLLHLSHIQYVTRKCATGRPVSELPLLEPPFVEAVNVVVPYNWNQYFSFSMLSLYIF